MSSEVFSITMIFIYLSGVICTAALWVVFEKAGKPGWYAAVPVLQTMALFRVTGYEWWWSLIPIVNLVFCVMALNRLARGFGYDVWMTLGLVFLPFVFIPYVALSPDVYMREAEWS